MSEGSPPATLLRLMWLASPALPVGGFSYSEGLEPAVEAGRVHDEATAGDWLLSQLALSQARSELPLLAQAFAAWSDDFNCQVVARALDLGAGKGCFRCARDFNIIEIGWLGGECR